MEKVSLVTLTPTRWLVGTRSTASEFCVGSCGRGGTRPYRFHLRNRVGALRLPSRMPLWIKICGITNRADALAAVEAGADALGFMFYDRSPRVVAFDTVGAIVRELPALIAKVGVFVNPTRGAVCEAIERGGLNQLQFHGEESPEFCRAFGLSAIKAFRIDGEEALRQLTEYSSETWLLDSSVPGQYGGTGQKFNWELASKAAKLNGRVIVAGGLTAANVADAVRQAQPYGVDVSSGVEALPGKKDHRKLQEFVQAARSVD